LGLKTILTAIFKNDRLFLTYDFSHFVKQKIVTLTACHFLFDSIIQTRLHKSVISRTILSKAISKFSGSPYLPAIYFSEHSIPFFGRCRWQSHSKTYRQPSQQFRRFCCKMKRTKAGDRIEKILFPAFWRCIPFQAWGL